VRIPLPRDDWFYDALKDLGVHLGEAARLLDRFFAAAEGRGAIAADLTRIESASDSLATDVTARIETAFLTPLDHADSHAMAMRVAGIVDLIAGTATRALLFDIGGTDRGAIAMAGVLARSAGALQNACAQLASSKAVHLAIAPLKQLEEEGDQLYHDATERLFGGDVPALEVIKWKDILDRLENSIDECYHMSGVLTAVLSKHA